MNCSIIFVVCASIAVLGSAALAESPGITRPPALRSRGPQREGDGIASRQRTGGKA